MIADTRLESYLKTPVRTLQEQVWDFIASKPNGATCHEVEWGLVMKHQTVSARIKELKDLNRIRATRTVWDSETGRNVNVYEANV